MKDLHRGRIKIFNALTGKIEETEKVYKTDEEWKKNSYLRAVLRDAIKRH